LQAKVESFIAIAVYTRLLDQQDMLITHYRLTLYVVKRTYIYIYRVFHDFRT